MPLHLIRPHLARLAFALLALGGTGLHAAPVTYTVQGHFTGTTSDDPALIAALSPLLGAGQALSLTLSIDTAAAASGVDGLGSTIYPAVTATSARFAGFDDAVSEFGCARPSDLICSLHVRDGAGGFSDPDRVSLFPAFLTSRALETASGFGRGFSLQLMMFFNDFSGSAFTSDAPSLDLSTLSPSGWRGEFGVFSIKPEGGFDRASFRFDVDSIRQGAPDSGHPLPEPGPLALLAIAAAGAALASRRRTSARRAA
ncbi:MAG: PEP-CTERM sorting domain-containing protein [Rubrivivax sp.]